MSNRHKAIFKTNLFHHIGILDKEWKVENKISIYKMHSPTFLIDGIYKSMEGPKASRYIQLNQNNNLYWITGFDIKAIDEKSGKKLSNDFICHLNIDINDVVYYSKLNLKNRIGKQYPRLTSLSHGLENFSFPKGFGIPVYGKDFLYVTTQTLNHNLEKISQKVKHEIEIKYSKKGLLPLMSKTVFIQLPFDEKNPYKENIDFNECTPVETKNHTYIDKNGKYLSGHWKIPLGKRTYKSNINEHLSLEKPLKLHFSAPHVHPFATNIGIRDLTMGKVLFNCFVSNYLNKVGLSKIDTFSSIEGIWFYPNHEYEMFIEVNNTSNIEQDMMGSMFLFFYDDELNSTLTKN